MRWMDYEEKYHECSGFGNVRGRERGGDLDQECDGWMKQEKYISMSVVRVL